MLDILGAFLVAMAILLILVMAVDLWAKKWPVHKGKVVDISEIHLKSNASNRTRTRLLVQYEYSIEQKQFQSVRMVLGGKFGLLAWRNDLLIKENGSNFVNVYVCPFFDGYCLLKPSVLPQPLSAIIALTILVVGLLCIIFF